MDLVPDDLPDLPHPATHGGGDLVGDDLPDLPDPNAPRDHKIEDRLGKGIAQRTAREAPADDDLSWGEALREGAHNFIPSAKENVKAFGDVITHPRETFDAFKQLGAGAVSKAEGALGNRQDPDKKASDERVINALMDHYKDVYGSAQGFKHAIAKDPTSILMDVGPTVLSPALGVAARAAGTATKAGKALSVARHFTDPVSATLYGAGKVAGGVNSVGKALASKSAGVPKSALDIAQAAGAETDPAMRDVFRRHVTGEGDAREVLNTAQDALEKARKSYSDEYKAAFAAHGASPKPVSPTHITNIERAAADVRSKVSGPGSISGAFDPRIKMLDQIDGIIDGFKKDPRYHNYEGLDWLKRAIRDKQYEHRFASHTSGGHDASEIANAVKAQIEDVAPGYNKTMEGWENALDNVRDITAGLGIGANAEATKAVSKMLKQMQKDNGQQLLTRLDKHRKDLKYMLAGHALQPWSHGGLRGLFDLLVSAGGAGALTSPGPLAWFAASSPRIMGEGQYAAGAASRAAGSMPAQVGKYGAMQLSHIEPREDQPDAQAPTPKTPSTVEDVPSDQPRGVRNRNRGNIKDGSFARSQPGYDGADDDGFAQFKTQDDGDAAGKGLLRNYIDNGHDTIEKIAKRWSPDPKEYGPKIKAMRDKLGINPGVRLDKRIIEKLWNSLTDTEVGQGHAAGGRIRRASGGRTINHDSEAAKLLAVVDKRLKHQNKTTEPLLEMHDDAVTKALKAADKYI